MVIQVTPDSCGPRGCQCPPWPIPQVLTSPLCPHLSRSAAKVGVSTTISWIRAGHGQQFWKASMESGQSPGPCQSHTPPPTLRGNIPDQKWMRPMSLRRGVLCKGMPKERKWKGSFGRQLHPPKSLEVWQLSGEDRTPTLMMTRLDAELEGFPGEMTPEQ